MKKLFIALLSMIAICATDAGASADNKIHWTFTVLTDGIIQPGKSDYSHDLGQTLAITLPSTMIQEGWACVRDEIVISQDGGFTCKNGQIEISNHVNCVENSGTQHNEMRIWDIKKSRAYPYGTMFMLVAECSR